MNAFSTHHALPYDAAIVSKSRHSVKRRRQRRQSNHGAGQAQRSGGHVAVPDSGDPGQSKAGGSPARERLAALLPLPLLTLALFSFLVWSGDLSLIHHRFGPGMLNFSRTWSCFLDFAARPGGAMCWLCGVASQYFVYPWAAALIVTLTALAIVLAAQRVIGARPLSWQHLLSYAPGVLIVVMVVRVSSLSELMLGTLLALLAANVVVRLPIARSWVRVTAYAALAAVTYMLAGGAVLFLALFAGVYELRARRPWSAALSVLPVAAVLCVAAATGFQTGPDIFWQRLLLLLPGTQTGIPYAGVVSPPHLEQGMTVLVMAAICAALALVRTRAPASTGPGRRAALRSAVHVLMVLAIAAIAAWRLHPGLRKESVRWDYYVRSRQWQKLLTLAGTLPRSAYNVVVVHDLNRALFHAGRLPYDMFRFEQMPAGLILDAHARLHDASALPYLERASNTAYELGLINEAEHYLHELLQQGGDRTSTLRLLAKINVIKKQPAAARVFAGYLAKIRNDIEGERWARDFLARMEKDPLLSDDPEIQHGRRCMWTEDSYEMLRIAEMDLRRLLTHNPDNRMAFEYLMAGYLLVQRPDVVVAHLGELSRFGYKAVPTLYEEAALIHQSQTKQQVLILGQPIRQDCEVRGQLLRRQLAECKERKMDEKSMARAMALDFSGSYFYYYLFRQSGIMR